MNSDLASRDANRLSKLRTYTSLPVRFWPMAWASTENFMPFFSIVTRKPLGAPKKPVDSRFNARHKASGSGRPLRGSPPQYPEAGLLQFTIEPAPGRIPGELSLVPIPAGISDPPALGRGFEQVRDGRAEALRVVGEQNVF